MNTGSRESGLQDHGSTDTTDQQAVHVRTRTGGRQVSDWVVVAVLKKTGCTGTRSEGEGIRWSWRYIYGYEVEDPREDYLKEVTPNISPEC